MLKVASLIQLALLPLSVAAGEREMWTDRPDQTESPYTVPAGRIQVESSLYSYSRSIGQRLTEETSEWGSFILKLGITEAVDLQAGWTPWIDQHNGTEGVGDLLFRLKWNVLGNDSGTTAIAIMPYVNVPSASAGVGSDDWSGGLIIPVTYQFHPEWYLAGMVFVGCTRDSDRNERFEPGFSASLGHDLSERLGAYVEVFAESSSQPQRKLQMSFDAGLTYALRDNLQLDVGLNWFFAGDRRINPFIGLSFRI